jgi:hypothetical protein
MRLIIVAHNMRHNIAAVMPHRERNASHSDRLTDPL